MAQSFPTRQVLARHIESNAALADAALPAQPVVPFAAALSPLHAMVLGVDPAPRRMPVAEVAAFDDLFTRGLLLAGVVPMTLTQLNEAIAQLAGDDARPLRKLYAIAEGAPFQQTQPALPLNARLVFTWQKDTATDPDLLLSTTSEADDPQALLQLIAWSETQGVFHFFERLGGRWVWAGSSLDALRPASRGLGPFDSHVNGGLVMKELKFPWVHWHSQSRSIDRGLLFPTPALASNPLFAKLEGAQVLEVVVQRGIRRWTRRRMQHDLQGNQLVNLRWYMRQVLWTTSVNLASSDAIARELPMLEELLLPESFLLDVDGFRAVATAMGDDIDLLPVSALNVSSTAYRAALQALGMHVAAAPGGPSVPGDTDFAFVVPERAFEDTVVLAQLIVQEVLSPRLALCLLAVDFCNPVFSPQRAALLDLVPEAIGVGDQGAALDATVIDAARMAPAGAPAARLVALWDDADLTSTVRRALAGFAQAAQARLRTGAGVEDVLRLADSRREAFRGRRLNEFRHTTARSGAVVAHLGFDEAANVVQKTSSLGEEEL